MSGTKGHSGAKPGERRGGRKKGTPNKWTGSLRGFFAGHCQAASQFIVDTMNNEDEPTELRLRAALTIMDRGDGKPAQIMRLNPGAGSFDISRLTSEQLRIGREIARAAATGLGDTD